MELLKRDHECWERLLVEHSRVSVCCCLPVFDNCGEEDGSEDGARVSIQDFKEAISCQHEQAHNLFLRIGRVLQLKRK